LIRKRIWELDALRGSCILGMVVIHLLWDAACLFRWELSGWFLAIKQWGGGIFFLICGISCHLGSHPVRRGLTVLGYGLLCSAVTVGIWLAGFSGSDICIYFGTLHCLGLCMLLWTFLRRLSTVCAAVLGILLTVLGTILLIQPIYGPLWLLPLGILPYGFATADYFPLLPYLGLFLLGACLGRTFYPEKQSILPDWSHRAAWLRFLCLCGRHALGIYLLHQPVITGFFFLLTRVL